MYLRLKAEDSLELTIRTIFLHSQRHLQATLKSFLNIYYKMSEKLRVLMRPEGQTSGRALNNLCSEFSKKTLLLISL